MKPKTLKQDINPFVVTRHLSEKGIPIFIPWKWKWFAGLSLGGLWALLYCLSNWYPSFEPALLPLSALDKVIPFWPQTIWIYLSGLPFLIVSFRLTRCTINMNVHLISLSALVIVSVLIFCFFPTRYPRELYPLTDELDFFTKAMISAVRMIDYPRNCSPSLHVSIAVLIALGFLDEQRKYLPLMSTWAGALCLSTLTTKQHYVFDVLTGFGMALLFFWGFHRKASYRLAGTLQSYYYSASSRTKRINTGISQDSLKSKPVRQ